MPRLPFITAIMARNEAQRYLPDVLDWQGQFGPILVLDDGSEDETVETCQKHPAVLRCERRAAVSRAWGAEASAREHLWRLASEVAEWVLICDADQVLTKDPTPLCQSPNLNAWAFPLYDCWDDPELYRDDGWWVAHNHPRPWLFNPHRVPEGWTPEWSPRGIHCGHAPANFPYALQSAPPEYAFLHWGYVSPADRAEKLARYRSQYHQMTETEQAHAESIADPAPTLRVLPFAKPIRILCGAPVRKDAAILQAHLASLDWQDKPPRVQVDYCFVDDFPEDCEGRNVLTAWVAERQGTVLRSKQPLKDFDDSNPVTHQWTDTALSRMAQLKHAIFAKAVEGNYDYVWLVDSDLILDRTVLTSLLSARKPVVAGIYWTRWHAHASICAGPQAWLRPPYQLALPHYPEHEFRTKLGVERALEKVGGLGACTLIARSVLEKGINFGKPPGFPSGGLMDGEDRHFCEWCRRLHVDMFADGWPDIFHVYHPRDVELIPDMMARLGGEHPTYPNTGHLVSLILTNVEDGVGPVYVRCRIGDGMLSPEVEHAVMNMKRGEEKMVRVHFPATTPQIGNLALAGKVRLVQVELVDCKPFGLPPVLENEYYVTSNGQVKDATQMTAAQNATFQATEVG